MSEHKIGVPKDFVGGMLERWLVHEGDFVEAGAPIAVVDKNGELHHIKSRHSGLVLALRLAEHTLMAGRVILAVVESFEELGRAFRGLDMSDEVIIASIKKIVEGVVDPQFKALDGKVDKLDAGQAAMRGDLTAIRASLDKLAPKP
jgi:pyruvate/2-oxoglutarate dehydrogenase complex dihydrolipoamide acyltransferase (E2) component